LARSPERREHITAELNKAGLDYQIIKGVDGHDLDAGNPAMVAPSLLTSYPFPAGVAGCALSHLRVYQAILANGLDSAMVLEDDVILPADLGTLIDAAAGHLTGAEVALLNYDGVRRMSLAGSASLPSGRLLALPLDVGQPASGAAYLITRKACERMNERMPPVQVPADSWGFFYRQGLLDRVRCVFPLAVSKSPEFASTIGPYFLGNGLKAGLLAPLARRKIPLLHRAVSYRRQRIWRCMTQSEIVDMPFVEKPSRLETDFSPGPGVYQDRQSRGHV
jgi:glycosyl transferase, family 25